MLSLDSGIQIPADVEAEVHTQSAVGELYVQLIPRSGEGPKLKDGDVIAQDRARVPTDVNTVLDARTAAWPRSRGTISRRRSTRPTPRSVDSGPSCPGWLTEGPTWPLTPGRTSIPLTTLIDQSKPILDSQTDSGGAIQEWASNLASVTDQLQAQDPAVAGILENGPGAAEEVRSLFDRLQPTLPVVLANLVSIGEVALAYQPSLEQLLVLLPQGTATTQAIGVAKRTPNRTTWATT